LIGQASYHLGICIKKPPALTFELQVLLLFIFVCELKDNKKWWRCCV